MDRSVVQHVLSLLESGDPTGWSLALGILDHHLSIPDSVFPNSLLDTVHPLASLMEDPVLARTRYPLQEEMATIIYRMARLANPLDMRFQELLLPLVRALKRRDGLERRAEELLVRLGLTRKQLTNIYFAFRERVGTVKHSMAIEWLVRHGSPHAVLALIEFLNASELAVAIGAPQWIQNMARRIFREPAGAGVPLEPGEMYPSSILDLYLPRKDRHPPDNPQLVQFLHYLATLVVTIHRRAQWHRPADQVRFLQSNVEGHILKILEMCVTGEAIDAFIKALTRGHALATRRFGEQDPHLNYVVVNMAMAAEDRIRELGVESRYLSRSR